MLAIVEKVMEAYERIATGTLAMSVRRANKLVDDADALVREAMRDPDALAELLRLIETVEDFDLKDWLRGRVLPDLGQGLSDPRGFRSHPLVNFTAEEMPIRPCLALVDVKGSIKKRDLFDEDYAYSCSWFAGSPVVEEDQEWPAAEDGFPYVHVVQADLGFMRGDFGGAERIFDDLGIPDSGVLQVFHDLETYGWDADEEPGWCVRWVENPTKLLDPPPMDRDGYRKPRLIEASTAISIPPVEVFAGEGESWERYHQVAMRVEDQLRSPLSQGKFKEDKRPTAWESDHVPEFPTSRIGGFGYHPLTDEIEEVLLKALPLSSAKDEYFLLFDVAGVRHLDGWFGDCGHLQVWIRSSDLKKRNFDDVWCIIRTG